MVKYRDHIFHYQKIAGDTEKVEQALNVSDPVSALTVEVDCQNGATSNEDNFISDIIKYVEVVNGTDTLVNLTGHECEALHFYGLKEMPCLFPSEWPATSGQRHNFLVPFGRKLWDKQYNLDPGQFDNPVINVEFNKAAVRAAGATGFGAGDTIKLTLGVKLMEGAKPADKFLMSKKIAGFTSAASGDKDVQLPRDYPYRLMMVRAHLEGYDIDEILTDLKISVDHDKYVPINRKVKQLDAEALSHWGLATLKHDIFRANGGVIRCFNNKEPNLQMMIQNAGAIDIVGASYQWSSNVQLILYTHAGAADDTARQITAIESGHALHAFLPIAFGELDEPETWFNPQDPLGGEIPKDVRLWLTQGTASGVCEVVLQQERSYI